MKYDLEKELAEAKKAWEKYKDLVPKDKYQNEHSGKVVETIYVFEDWVKETEAERKTKTTTFRIGEKSDQFCMFSSTSKSQKFLVVSGPLAGQRVVEQDHPDYVLFNLSGRHKVPKGLDVPSCVLVHKDAFEVKV